MMDKALLLLQIQKQALETTSLKELGFLAVNVSKKIVDYRRAVFWTVSGKTVNLHNISGNAVLDPNGPHGIWLKDVLQKEIKGSQVDDIIHPIELSGLSEEETKEWLGYSAPNASIVFFKYGEDQQILGGLWLEREAPLSEADTHILNELSFYYTRAMVLNRVKDKRDFLPLSDKVKPYRKYIWIILCLLAFLPVRLTISAPAEVIAVSSMTVSVPFDGILNNVLINPGSKVDENMPVAEMDLDSLTLQADTSSEAYRASLSRLSRLQREVLSSPEKKTELHRLLSEIKTKEIEADYAKTQLDKAVIKAPRAGIAIFADKNDLKNKPVRTGQPIMQIADPAEVELLIRIPLQSMLPVGEEADISFFPNATPLVNYAASIDTIGYQASADADGLLTYKIRALLNDKDADIRIGWKGVAKINGQRTILIYKILRRPLITLRSMLGV